MTYLENPELKQIWVHPENSAVQLWYHTQYDIVTMIISNISKENPNSSIFKWQNSIWATAFYTELIEILNIYNNITQYDYYAHYMLNTNSIIVIWLNKEIENLKNDYRLNFEFKSEEDTSAQNRKLTFEPFSYYPKRTEELKLEKRLEDIFFTKEHIIDLLEVILENSRTTQLHAFVNQLEEKTRTYTQMFQDTNDQLFNLRQQKSENSKKSKNNEDEKLEVLHEIRKEAFEVVKPIYSQLLDKRMVNYSAEQFLIDLNTIKSLLREK